MPSWNLYTSFLGIALFFQKNKNKIKDGIGLDFYCTVFCFRLTVEQGLSETVLDETSIFPEISQPSLECDSYKSMSDEEPLPSNVSSKYDKIMSPVGSQGCEYIF